MNKEIGIPEENRQDQIGKEDTRGENSLTGLNFVSI